MKFLRYILLLISCTIMHGDGTVTITGGASCQPNQIGPTLIEVPLGCTVVLGGANFNVAPVAGVAADFSAVEGTTVSLVGTTSTDSDGTIDSYIWEQGGGTPAIALTNANTATATFTAPAAGATLTFFLIVVDNDGVGNLGEITVTTVATTSQTVFTYYVADCQAGNDADCVAGDDSNDGLSKANAWKTYDKARLQFSSLADGESIGFAKGGSFLVDGSDDRWTNQNSTAGTGVTIGSYTPTWASGDETNPQIVVSDTTNNVFDLADGGNANVEAGYIFRNLALSCTGGASSSGPGFWMQNDVDNVTISGVSINGCRVGVNSSGSNTCDGGDATCDGVNSDLKLSSVSIVNSIDQGYLGTANNLTIENSTFTGNGTVASFDHNIYVSGGNNISITGNTLYQSAIDGSSICQGASFVAHGTINTMLIENNTIYEALNKAASGCWGIAVDTGYSYGESFTDITIRNNTITNVGNQFIGVASCIDCVIENNTLAQSNTIATTAISAPNRTRGATDAVFTGVTVKNNTFTMNGTSLSTFISVTTEGTGHTVINNTATNNSSGAMTCTALSSPATFTDTTGSTCN